MKIALKVLMLMLVLGASACQREVIRPDEASPAVSKSITEKLELSKANLRTYLPNKLQLLDYAFERKISDASDRKLLISQISDDQSWFAVGDVADPQTVQIAQLAVVSEAQQARKSAVDSFVNAQVQVGQGVVKINWKAGDHLFTTRCVVSDTGIVWDNVLSNLLIVTHLESSDRENEVGKVAVYTKWYRQWWTASWLWGSKRGEMGYKITIHCTSSTHVSSTDRQDWANITIGNARSESRILRNSGSYGKIQYALGMSTPTVTLHFNSGAFQVSTSGIGSNIVRNGTKSLYP